MRCQVQQVKYSRPMTKSCQLSFPTSTFRRFFFGQLQTCGTDRLTSQATSELEDLTKNLQRKRVISLQYDPIHVSVAESGFPANSAASPLSIRNSNLAEPNSPEATKRLAFLSRCPAIRRCSLGIGIRSIRSCKLAIQTAIFSCFESQDRKLLRTLFNRITFS